MTTLDKRLDRLFRQHPEMPHIHIFANGKIVDGYTDKPFNQFNNGYGYPKIMIDGKGYLVHRLVALVWCDNPDPIKNTIVNHIDGNKGNSVFTNLEWCDYAHNMEHAISNKLRGDNIAIKLMDMATHKTLHFNSITRCAKYFGVSTELFARKVNGKIDKNTGKNAIPAYRQYVVAKEGDPFPKYTLAQLRDLNIGFKLPLAYKPIDGDEWFICGDGIKEVSEATGITPRTIERILSPKEKKDRHNGYLVRRLTGLEYANCELVKKDSKGGNNLNNAPTPIEVLNTKTGEIKRYDSTQAFADVLGVDRKSLQHVRLCSPDKRSYAHYKIDFLG